MEFCWELLIGLCAGWSIMLAIAIHVQEKDHKADKAQWDELMAICNKQREELRSYRKMKRKINSVIAEL